MDDLRDDLSRPAGLAFRDQLRHQEFVYYRLGDKLAPFLNTSGGATGGGSPAQMSASGPKSGPMQRSKWARYSITSSARPISIGGTSMPSALAVDRLMTSSNLVGCWTGKSAGLAPLRILCTYVAVCRDKSGRFAP